MLLTLCVGTFVATSSGSALAPFLQVVATDLSTDLPTVAHLFGFQAITWGTASLLAGVWSDRIGRKNVLVVTLATLGVARILFAYAHSYPTAVVWQLVSGLAGGAFMGTVFATVSDHVAPEKRGRSLSWIITGQSLSLLLGVPLITFLGNILGGRIADATHSRPLVFARSSLATALIAVPTFIWHPGLMTSVLLAFGYSFVNALGRPSLLATLSDVPSEIRGALFGIQIATASMGWLLAASVGAILIATSEFAALGLFAGGLALLGAGLTWLSVGRAETKGS